MKYQIIYRYIATIHAAEISPITTSSCILIEDLRKLEISSGNYIQRWLKYYERE